MLLGLLLFAAIHFDNFAGIQELNLVGDARLSGDVLRLTPARRNQTGAAWYREKQPVQSGFETTFQFQLTHEARLLGGADGFAFVLQNSGPEALGGRGSAGGFGVADPDNPHHPGIPWSVAVFFDTWRNSDEGDPSANYIAVRVAGKPADMQWPAARLAFTPELKFRLQDRKVHSARIVFQPPVLSVFLDGSATPVLETAVDLSIVADPRGAAWVGFTASTGFAYQNHDIRNWRFVSTTVSSSMAVVSSDITFPMSDCLPERNLCTPERAFVERKTGGYHIVLPGNLEWGVSVPNAFGRTVKITDSHGIVCWDLKARGSNGCGGPAGSGAQAGPGFLAADAPAGALVMNTRQGRTWFSVNDRSGAGFNDNEGFYEFDVAIQ